LHEQLRNIHFIALSHHQQIKLQFINYIYNNIYTAYTIVYINILSLLFVFKILYMHSTLNCIISHFRH